MTHGTRQHSTQHSTARRNPAANPTPPLDAAPERTLLVPLDGTDFSRRIIDRVRDLFAPERFRIALLHVADPPANLLRPYRPALVGLDTTLYAYEMGHRPAMPPAGDDRQRHAIYEGDLDAAYRERLERELDGELATFRSAGYEVTASVHFGDPVAEIVTVTENEAVDVIAMATHGRSGLSLLFRGSVAQDVLDRVRIPVLLLHTDESEPNGDPAVVAGGAHASDTGYDEVHDDEARDDALRTMRRRGGTPMTWTEIRDHWTEIRPQAKRAWPKLSDAELEAVDGRREALIDKVRDSHRMSHEEATTEVDRWAENLDTTATS